MSIPNQNVNAWLLIGEDNPAKSSYKTPGSCYQTLIDYKVYRSTDQVNLCFFVTLPTSKDTIPAGDGSQFTLQLGNPNQTHPDGSTNQDYMNWIIQDSRAEQPDIKLLTTLAYDKPYITNVLNQNTSSLKGKQLEDQRQKNATNFANNLVQFMVHYELNGFDIDWEYALDGDTPEADFSLFLTAIRTAFDTQNASKSVKQPLYLTISPASTQNLDGDIVNKTADWLNLQIYGGASPPQYSGIGINKDLLQFGCKFESNGSYDPAPYQTAANAYQNYKKGNYKIAINWRLNSGNFHYEQASQIILAQFIRGTGLQFNDTKTLALAQNPPITEMLIRHGEVLNAIQPTNTGSFQGSPTTYILPLHGGDSGTSSSFTLNSGELITEVSGYTGVWFGWKCVLQVSFKTSTGRTFGPYGTMANSTSKNPFSIKAKAGQSINAFAGTLVNVPLANGNRTDIISNLTATSASPSKVSYETVEG